MLSVVTFFGLNIAIATEGAAGKHLYDTTYAEFADSVARRSQQEPSHEQSLLRLP